MSTPERSRRRRRHSNPEPGSPPIRLTFVSPRIQTEFDPPMPPLTCPEERFQYQSQLAGNHRQDGSVFRVVPNDPAALGKGMPRSAAARVRTLLLPAVESELLPEWMDVVANTFQNLKHLHVPEGKPPENRNEVDENVERTASADDSDNSTENNENKRHDPMVRTLSEEALVRRLYVLYRLPGLKTMDGSVFSPRERMLSQPRDNVNRSPKKDKSRGKSKISGDGKKSRKNRKPICLLDAESEDEDSTVVSLKTRKAMAEAAVEVALNGSILSLKNNVVRSPTPDPDRWEYSSVESNTAACEWACGSLSLPWRKKQGRKRRDKLSVDMTDSMVEPSIEIHPEDIMLRVSTPPRVSYSESTGSSPLVESPISTSSSLGSYQASKSLTSPFPMQFRTRVTTAKQIVLSTAHTVSTEDLLESSSASSDKFAPLIPSSSLSDTFSSELQVIESTSFGNRNRSISERLRIVPVSRSIPLARTTSSPLPRPPNGRRPAKQRGGRRLKWRVARSLSIIDKADDDDDDGSDVSEP